MTYFTGEDPKTTQKLDVNKHFQASWAALPMYGMLDFVFDLTYLHVLWYCYNLQINWLHIICCEKWLAVLMSGYISRNEAKNGICRKKSKRTEVGYHVIRVGMGDILV